MRDSNAIVLSEFARGKVLRHLESTSAFFGSVLIQKLRLKIYGHRFKRSAICLLWTSENQTGFAELRSPVATALEGDTTDSRQRRKYLGGLLMVCSKAVLPKDRQAITHDLVC
jgi:hypothetical protein